jgi:hypothetical protein
MKLLRVHVAQFTFHSSFWNENRNKPDVDQNEEIALRMLPTTIGLVHSIVELINSGWLYTSEVVFRSALERTSTISYILTRKEEALAIWRNGWKMGERPSLKQRIETFPTTSPAAAKIKIDSSAMRTAKDGLISLIPSLNSAVHGDDFSLRVTVAKSEDGFDFYNHTNDLESPEYASSLCILSAYLPIFLTLIMDNSFPSFLSKAET